MGPSGAGEVWLDSLKRGEGKGLGLPHRLFNNGLKSVAPGLPESEHTVNNSLESGTGPTVQVETCVTAFCQAYVMTITETCSERSRTLPCEANDWGCMLGTG